jgi:SAM-dependent methyltransferase
VRTLVTHDWSPDRGASALDTGGESPAELRASGLGPGEFSYDGNSVELYAQLPTIGEPDLIASVVPAGTTILELGAGVGRVTHELLERGYPVVAVDVSWPMLERIRGARTITCRIEDLDLEERFGAIMLCSFLINTTSARSAAAYLRCCRRHLAEDGQVVIQRQGKDWFSHRPVPPAWQERGIRTKLLSVERIPPDVSEVQIEYEIDGSRWVHAFQSRDVPEAELEQALDDAGLTVSRYLTDNRSWLVAVAR